MSDDDQVRPGLPRGPVPLTDKEFAGYQRLVYREAGIWLSPAKRALLMGRVSRRLRELDGMSFGTYLMRAEEDEAERVRLVDAICTHETHFFREPRHFELLEHEVLPRWRGARRHREWRGRRVYVWSAGCSTGEEPFTLAMVLRHHLPAEEGWNTEILARTSPRASSSGRARSLWPVDKAEEIPSKYLRGYMLKGVGSQEGRMKAGPELRSLVRFQRANLKTARDCWDASTSSSAATCSSISTRPRRRGRWSGSWATCLPRGCCSSDMRRVSRVSGGACAR